MNTYFTSKLPNVGTTIFTVMSKLAADHGAINLSQGFPNFEPSSELIELVTKYMRLGYNQYAPMIGVQPLREALSHKVFDAYKTTYHPETEITVTSGATEALFAAITAVVRPGDEVIVFEPAYDSYVPAIELNGGVPVYVTLEPPCFAIDWEVVAQKITPKTKLIVVNTPHNPAGSILNRNDLNELARLVENTDILILSDEVYEHIIFDGAEHCSLLTHPDLQERSFVVGSFGKTFHVTGWKVGYCLAPSKLTTEFRKVHQYLTFCTFGATQYALAEFLHTKENYLSVAGFYQQKRDVFLHSVKNSRFTWSPSAGTYFQNLSYSEITDENDVELAMRLTREIGVAAIPISVFYHDKRDFKYLRFCFAKDDYTLQMAGEKLSLL